MAMQKDISTFFAFFFVSGFISKLTWLEIRLFALFFTKNRNGTAFQKLFVTLLCVNLCRGIKSRMVCEELDDIFNEDRSSSESHASVSQGIPGKRGAVGAKGAVGPPGPPGPVNEVALQRLEHEITQRTRSTEEELTNLKTRLSRLEENFVSKESLEICDFFYKGKCFFLLMPVSRLHRPALETACVEHGGHLANIYSRDHFEKAKSLIRSKTLTGYSYNHIWTGMNVDIQRRRIRLSTGEWAPYQRWYPNRPYTPARAAVGIHINFATSSSNAGMFDEHDTSKLLGGLCERSID